MQKKRILRDGNRISVQDASVKPPSWIKQIVKEGKRKWMQKR